MLYHLLGSEACRYPLREERAPKVMRYLAILFRLFKLRCGSHPLLLSLLCDATYVYYAQEKRKANRVYQKHFTETETSGNNTYQLH